MLTKKKNTHTQQKNTFNHQTPPLPLPLLLLNNNIPNPIAAPEELLNLILNIDDLLSSPVPTVVADGHEERGVLNDAS